jgi:YVTN family beta-propeller protein
VRAELTFRLQKLGALTGSVVLLSAIAAICGASRLQAAQAKTESAENVSQENYLTPVELKFSPDGTKLYVVCEDDDSLLAVDVHAQRVLAKVKVGHKPKDVAVSPDGKTLYVTNEWDDTVSEIDAAGFSVRRTLPTGWGPVGVTTDRAGKVLYVANSVGNDVSVLDLTKGVELKRLASWRSPHNLLLSRDGRRVYVANMLGHLGPPNEPPVSELTVIDTAAQRVTERIEIPGVLELRHISEAPGAKGSYLLVPIMRPKNLNPLIQVAGGWILTHGMVVVKVGGTDGITQAKSSVTQILLDDVDQYFAGTNGVAFTPDGRFALVTSSEADTVTAIDTAKLERRLRQVPAEELANRLDSAKEIVARRMETGANPTGIAISQDGKSAYVVNRLGDSLTVVDIARLQVRGTIDLGGPKELSKLRRGEQMFHAARFCFQGQFACSTCHPDNHIDGVAWNLETPQLGRDRVANRTLRGIAETAPYKWNGHNPDLETQCGPRIAKFLFHSEGFNSAQLSDLVAFIKAIPLPPNHHLAADGQLTPSQEHGRTIFFQKFCDTCHTPATHYTARISFDVGTATKYDTNGFFDVPQLDRIVQRPPYLHSGEALSLEELWTIYNPQDRHGVTSDMNKEDLNDLIEFLKSL